ncbi:MAG TPA: 6-phosphogluconolactonase [Candidatus Acidoferrales bacterium]|jgi:6-phosphogluconolactonase|nr:6-phosphogluconolactonase [Candidatus Acidoferrales bacterium]
MDDTGETRSAGVSPAPFSDGISSSEPRVMVCTDEEVVARAAAELFVQLSGRYIADEGAFRVALSGGNTPRPLYRLLGSDEFRSQVDWRAVQLFWGDERGVPPDHPESNYGVVHRELLPRVSIPRENIHRMEAERPDVEQAAREYEQVLRRELPLNALGVPQFDLVLLGLGADGHTASLLPTSKDWRDARDLVAAPHEQISGVRRMTLALPVLNAARHVIFLVTGEAKADILRRVVKERDPSLPARQVRPTQGELLFIVDRAAAARLEGSAG